MATWSLTIDNAINRSDNIYIMEDDGTGFITSPRDLIFPFLPIPPHVTLSSASDVIKRCIEHLVIGGSDFPSPCQVITAGNTGTLIVSSNTTTLKLWTFSNGAWTSKDNITPRSLADRDTVVIPRI